MAATMAAAIRPARIAEVAFRVFSTGTCQTPTTHQHPGQLLLLTMATGPRATQERRRGAGASSIARERDLQRTVRCQGVSYTLCSERDAAASPALPYVTATMSSKL
jgi:hypothetical protein